METISYLNISVNGVPFITLSEVEINHTINEHATAIVSGGVALDIAKKYMNRVDERTIITITANAQGQPQTLFCGVVSDAGVQIMSDYAVLRLCLKSMSVLSDYGKKNKSYQNTSKTHEEIIKQASAGCADIDMQVTDRAIGNMIVQCNETCWEFIKRIASRLAAPVITSIDSYIPVFTIGIPKNCKNYNMTDSEAESFMKDEIQGTFIKTTQYVFLGDSIEYGNMIYRVSSVHSSIKSGILITSIGISTENGFKQEKIVNNQISGRMYIGEVQHVKEDKVQVHLTDIDREYDSGGDVWLPYSTAYSSNDGSGLYCMPAEKDKVRVFFPGSDEGQAFAASSVSVNSAADVTDKQWTGPNGKQILMTKEGIFITTNSSDNKVFINLTDSDGIIIKSNKNINICAKKNLSIISNDRIEISAENDILISSAESYIDIKPGNISLGAENVVIK